MKKYMIFLFITILFLSLTAVAAENTTDHTYTQTTSTTQQTTTTTNNIQTDTHNTNTYTDTNNEISTITTDTDSSEETATEVQTSNKTHKQVTNTIQKTQKTNIKTASASEELKSLESSTKTNLEKAFSQAKTEIDNAQSTYEKEQIPNSVIQLANKIIRDAEEAETIYANSGDSSLTETIENIRNYAGYAYLLIHPEDLWNYTIASSHIVGHPNQIWHSNGHPQIFSLWGQKNINGSIVSIDVPSDRFEELYNSYYEIDHKGGFDDYNQVISVPTGNFVWVMNESNTAEFTDIPYPFVRVYLESMYHQGFPYQRTYGGVVYDGNQNNINGTTLKYTTSSIAFWKMKKGTGNQEYLLTNERYYPDTNGKLPQNMPRAKNNDEDGIYFVGYVIKNEDSGIHIDGVIIEYRAEEETINITVNKKWNDANNQDGIRPSTVTVQLLADGEVYGDNIVLRNDNNWTYHYINLPKNNAQDKEIVYTINEVSVPTGYTVSYDNFTVVNTHIPETVEIEAIKEWDDAYNQDGIRPENVTVNLLRNGVRINSATLSENNNWRARFTNLAKYQNGNPITYTVTENNIDSRYTTSIRRVDNEFIITNSYKPLTTNVTVSKVWDDNDNQDGIRPYLVRFQLLGDNTPVGNPITLNEGNNWKHTFTDLPLNSNGHKITYQVIETSVPTGYTATNNGLTITNTHKPETTELEVFKEWDDDHNRDGIRPNSVTVNLYKNNKLNQTITLSTSNNWRHYFKDLDVYENGERITYTVTERNITQYNTTITRTGNEFIIVNSHKPNTRNVTIQKVWDDKDNQDGIRPNSVTFQLLANNAPYQNPVTLNARNNWTYTFTGLPVNANGTPVTYRTIETSVPTGYTATNNGLTITNTHKPETTELEVFKEWDDDHNRDGIRPNGVTVNLLADGEVVEEVVLNHDTEWRYKFHELPVYKNGNKITYSVNEKSINNYTTTISNINGEYVIVNSHKPVVKSLDVIKVWDDHDNEHELRPDSIQVQLFADGEKYGEYVTVSAANNWKYTYTNLPVNFDGKTITYFVEEVGVPEDYVKTIDVTSDNEITITNIFDPEHTQVDVIKEWDDDYNSDGLRPGSVQVQLYANGAKQGQPVTLSQDNYWRYSFVNLLKYIDDVEVEYTVEEVTNTPGYSSSLLTIMKNEFAIINTHIPEKVNITINKIWDDADDQDGLRPESVRVELLADGEKYDTAVLNKNNGWSYTFTDLNKNFDGEAIEYSIDEIGIADGYTASHDGYTITNTHIPETTEIHVVKEWTDNNNQDGLRPANVTITLQANGKTIQTLTLNRANNWTQVVTNLPTNENGKAIKYTVTETPVPNYTNAIEYNNEKIIINNIHTPQTKNITINKKWNDNNNQDGLRPANVNVQVLADDELYTTIVLSSKNNWTNTLTNLPIYYKGVLINYTLEEIGTPTGYTATINGYTITNTHKPETTEIHVVKEWTDNDNQDGLRPDSITVTLKANDKAIQTLTLSSKNNWTQIINNLPTNENGKTITYTVTEAPIANYTNTITYNNEKIIINNIHDPETINITINKKWNDNNNQDGLRPNSIPVTILKDGEAYINTTLTSKNNWTTTLNNLPKFNDGREVKYVVDEVGTPTGYTSRTVGYTITNTHVPGTVEVVVIVEWDDLDDIDEIRPENVTIILYKNDEPVENVTISPDEDWRNIFDELPEYENGTKINYTADEILPNGYNRTIEINDNEIIITNIHRPKLVNITINKVWADDNNRDGLRPENVKVQLLSNGKVYATVTLSDVNNWKYSFINLPKSRKGINIKYTLREVTNITGYTSSVNKFTITNKHEPETVDVKVNVEWDDLNDTDKIRPENVTIILYADDEPVENVTITPDDDWKTIFEDLPKYDNGTVINYTADEILPDGYNKTIDLGDNEINITNIHRPTIDINVDIVWDDLDDVDGIRPDNVTIVLYADGKVVRNVTVTKDTWKTVFENLPKYDENGNPIKYTIDEVLPNGYTKTIESDGNNFVVTNVHRPETKNVTVQVRWDDLNDIDGIRPDNVTIRLYADGEVVREVTVTPEDDWNVVFDNLPLYDKNSNLIKYTVDEVLPSGYTRTIESDGDNFVITNIHRPQLVWTWKLVEILDDNNQDNISNVPEPVNNQPVKIVGKKVSSYNNWKINNRYGKYYKYNKYNRHNRYYRNNYRHYNGHVLSRHAYRLYIQLYNEYLAGNISFEDFIVLLEKEGVDTQVLNFNEDGTITIDYDNIEDVPDKITVEYKNDDIPSTSDNIDTSNPDNNEAPVIDSGRVEVNSEHTDSSSNSDVEE